MILNLSLECECPFCEKRLILDESKIEEYDIYTCEYCDEKLCFDIPKEMVLDVTELE